MKLTEEQLKEMRAATEVVKIWAPIRKGDVLAMIEEITELRAERDHALQELERDDERMGEAAVTER